MSWLQWVQHHDEVESTMQVALQAAESGAPAGTTIVAKSQRAGRGRRGRSWYSPPGGGLWMTTLLYPDPTRPAHTLSLVAGGAIWAALRQLGYTEAKLKWPNDVEARDRKLAGILLECTSLKNQPNQSVILMGIGLNLAPAETLELPEDIKERYIGLGDLLEDIPYEQVLESVVSELERATHAWQRDGLEPTFALWDEADALAGERVRAAGPDGPIEGIARGLGPEGQLKLQTADAEILIDAGEVTRVRKEA